MTNSTPASPDVRMHGFSRRSEVPDVLEWIDRSALRLPSESVSLEEAAGRILAAALVSPLDVPGFDRAAMDGYALRGADTAGASEYNPLDFPVVGQTAIGVALGAEQLTEHGLLIVDDKYIYGSGSGHQRVSTWLRVSDFRSSAAIRSRGTWRSTAPASKAALGMP